MKNAPASLGALACILAFSTGCSGWLRFEGGFVTETTLKREGMGAGAGIEAALGERKDPVILDLALRGKVTARGSDSSFFAGVLHLKQPKPVGYYLIGGLYLLQYGESDNRASFGMFSPVAEGGIAISTDLFSRPTPTIGLDIFPDPPRMFTIGTRIEYDVRFTPQPHAGFWTLNVGYALGVGNR